MKKRTSDQNKKDIKDAECFDCKKEGRMKAECKKRSVGEKKKLKAGAKDVKNLDEQQNGSSSQ